MKELVVIEQYRTIPILVQRSVVGLWSVNALTMTQHSADTEYF